MECDVAPADLDDFLSAAALRQVPDFQTLEKTVAELLDDPAARARLGTSACEVVESRRGVIAEMVHTIG
jgi:3-deoxy-D-manno-octulosonic-acid transferase